MEKWVERLFLLGFSGSEKRRKVVLDVLETNSADVLDFLVFESRVSEWEMIGLLSCEEKQFLVNASDLEKNIHPLCVALCGCVASCLTQLFCSFKTSATQSGESWTMALKLCCFPANDERCVIIAAVLSDNGIHSIDRFVRHPSIRNLAGAASLLNSEHTALLELARLLRIQRGRKE